MPRRPDEPPRKRFSKSGHTSHQPYTGPSQSTPPPSPPPPAAPPQYDAQPGFTPYSPPTYNAPPAPPASPAVAMTKAALAGTNRAARTVTHKVVTASKAGGADESGLTALIWNQVLSYGTDAMITVALAGTVFFGASAHAQRGNVLLYLLVTMAPFALIAPVIGPALDRLQHGRRWTMAATAIGRAVLALIMASHPSDLLWLYPCALGSLVLSKAYAVVRAAAAPRLVPPGMTLTQANSRLTIFGLASTLVMGGFVGVVIKTTGSYSAGLWLTAIAYGVTAYFAFRLPPQVDSAVSAAPRPKQPRRARAHKRVPFFVRLRNWARRGFDPHVVLALQGESALRLLSGLLTIYLAFYVEGTAHGLEAALQLALVIGAAGLGNFSGTAIGTKIAINRPEAVIVASVAITAGVCVLVALVFGILFAVIGMYLAAVANALCKIALDSLIQRDVAESLRSSAFGRSETFLQLSWVLGAAIGVVLPSGSTDDGAIGFWVAGLLMAAAAIVVGLRLRVTTRRAPVHPPKEARPPAASPTDARPPAGSPPEAQPAFPPPSASPPPPAVPAPPWPPGDVGRARS
ncbi:MAG TPA: MFS transporter [Jatrophihabitantaceae bacterium]